MTTDRGTSQHFSMPQSTIERDQVVDGVVPVHRIADHLVRRLLGAGSGVESVP